MRAGIKNILKIAAHAALMLPAMASAGELLPGQMAVRPDFEIVPSVDLAEGLKGLSRCSGAARETVEKWEKAQNLAWHREPNTLDGGKVFRSPTSSVGVWVELTAFRKTIEARKITPDNTLKIVWQDEDCVPKVTTYSRTYDSKYMAANFTDKDLQSLVNDHREGGLVYTWSPQMPLSIGGYSIAKKIADKYHLAFVPVLDAAADETAARKIASENGFAPGATKKTESLEILLRGMTRHFPSALVFSNGRIRNSMLPGLAPAETYDEFVKGMLKEGAK